MSSVKSIHILRNAALAGALAVGVAGALAAGPAQARPGCLKGALVGGVAGHLVGHGVLGAAAGCAYGSHERNKYDRRDNDEGRSSYAPRQYNQY
ncbi:hypothetical protein Msil_0217 [Methylocella silvestris BL2]|uniref:17 kDa surface antigen n=1 Tax=Methylocella silvestris (strain DSM 15510 / CIP 108128 / LMG 27833 / NCIMB 13906 / BL2) TaxID=395965 RepID=B8ENW0_METSB|nr:hypothetical protein [Methylocella silvestris]ACK49198.1 hypothetical protein Msil_0217 [Methylocella silvestris BL2]